MAEFPDLLINPNPNAPTLDASGNQVRGINIFETTAERDALNITVRIPGALAVIKGSDELYQYTASTVDDTAWQNPSNWLGVGSAGGSGVQNLNNLNGNVTLTAGDGIEIDVITGAGEIEISSTGAGELIELTDTPAGYGTSGQVLTTNGTNATTWGTPEVYGMYGYDWEFSVRENPYTAVGHYEGTLTYVGGSAFTAGVIYYWNNFGTYSAWVEADASAASTASGWLMLSLGSSGNLVNGTVYLSSVPGSAGDVLYLSTTAGAITNVIPTGSQEIVRVLGYKIDDNRIYFNPSADWIEIA